MFYSLNQFCTFSCPLPWPNPIHRARCALQKAGAGWDLHVPARREGLPLPCIAKAFCFCDIWATAAVIRRGLPFLEIISKVSMLFVKICSVHCELVTVIQKISAYDSDNLLETPSCSYPSEGWELHCD